MRLAKNRAEKYIRETQQMMAKNVCPVDIRLYVIRSSLFCVPCVAGNLMLPHEI